MIGIDYVPTVEQIADVCRALHRLNGLQQKPPVRANRQRHDSRIDILQNLEQMASFSVVSGWSTAIPMAEALESISETVRGILGRKEVTVKITADEMEVLKWAALTLSEGLEWLLELSAEPTAGESKNQTWMRASKAVSHVKERFGIKLSLPTVGRYRKEFDFRDGIVNGYEVGLESFEKWALEWNRKRTKTVRPKA